MGKEYERADEKLAEERWGQAATSGQIHPELLRQIAIPDQRSLSSRGQPPGERIQALDADARADAGLSATDEHGHAAGLEAGAEKSIAVGTSKEPGAAPAIKALTLLANSTTNSVEQARLYQEAGQVAQRAVAAFDRVDGY